MIGVEDMNCPGIVRRNQYLVQRHGQRITNISTGESFVVRIRSDIDHIELHEKDAERIGICDTFETSAGQLFMVTDEGKYRPGIRLFPIRRRISFGDLYRRPADAKDSFGRAAGRLELVHAGFPYFVENSPKEIYLPGSVGARQGDVVELHGVAYELVDVFTFDGMTRAILG